jgi:CubicO group peptidase (beta-lactamase class C family)
MPMRMCRSMPQTIYHWASITKTMTGIAILQLRDRGLLKLDDPIVRYVPELAGCTILSAIRA